MANSFHIYRLQWVIRSVAHNLTYTLNFISFKLTSISVKDHVNAYIIMYFRWRKPIINVSYYCFLEDFMTKN